MININEDEEKFYRLMDKLGEVLSIITGIDDVRFQVEESVEKWSFHVHKRKDKISFSLTEL